jgi:hypothetical protein
VDDVELLKFGFDTLECNELLLGLALTAGCLDAAGTGGASVSDKVEARAEFEGGI